MKDIAKKIFFNSTIALLLIGSFIFNSCEKIDQPFENPPLHNSVDTSLVFDTIYSEPNGNKRYILIEEFTGHTCTNCPDGAREVQRLDSIFGKQLIPVSIHAGYFAKPKNPPDTAYLTDFRIPDGETYNSTFAVWGNPSAMVSRIESGGAKVLAKSAWENVANSIKNDPAKATIDLTNLYNESEKLLKVKVSTKFLTSQTGNFNLQLYLIEDHVTDWQLDGTFHNPNYDHRHVLRKVINGTWGTPLPSANANDTASFEFSLNLNSSWKKNDCEVVAFIYNSTSGHTKQYEVIQANEAKLKK